MSFRNCFTNCSVTFSSLSIVTVILERSLSSVGPTDKLSMLKLLALNMFETLKSTPGLFSTSAEIIFQPIFSPIQLRSCPSVPFQEPQMDIRLLLDRLEYQLQLQHRSSMLPLLLYLIH